MQAQQSQVILKVGILLPQVGQQATLENVIQTAKMAEKEGIDSVCVGERLLWPVNPQTPKRPRAPHVTLPVEGQNVLDPLETLTYVAANTNKIALGTSVIDMLFHNPVVLARRIVKYVISQTRPNIFKNMITSYY
jgi:alkanesulfonate monooxygenase SsuD/methylene tetrahydromethanopterin reductase-like flavin-dependent oxidoreductase (luciferase family)